MVIIRYFGLTRFLIQKNSDEVEAKRVDELLEKISKKYEEITLKDIKNSVIFVNRTNIVDLNVFKTKLKDGDEVYILSPLGGG